MIDDKSSIEWIKKYFITKFGIKEEYIIHICYEKDILVSGDIGVIPTNLFTALLQRGIYNIDAIGKNEIMVNGDHYQYGRGSLKAVLDIQIR